MPKYFAALYSTFVMGLAANPKSQAVLRKLSRIPFPALKGPVQRHCFATANMPCFPVIGNF